MDEFVPFGSGAYFGFLALLLFARGTDFLSTWVATPNLVLEANPVAKKLGWKWGIPLNIAFCIAISIWPLPAIIIATASVLVAARNFQNAWLMRAFGEESYRAWHRDRLLETGFSLYMICLLAQTLLTAAVGLALVCFSPDSAPASAIGWGILAYAAAVIFYTLLSLWRLRRSLG
jgi:hypothetical protein